MKPCNGVACCGHVMGQPLVVLLNLVQSVVEGGGVGSGNPDF